MTTHELAKALTLLAKMLRSGPNIDLYDLDLRPANSKRSATKPSDPTALSAFVAFSKFDKQQWTEVINAYDLPIAVSPSHSARDLMGKIMGYFADNPKARQRLSESVERQPSQASPELMKALATLLRS